ncbi:MAG TPA: zinc-binding dehydrogenase [Gemmatimonadaceae bacterium]|nr:zinc-binding dehydrogenase [Gemmatimonadaceae bacterium]
MSSRFVSQKVVFFVASIKPDDLNVLNELVEANKLTPVIDRRFTLDEVAEAMRCLKEGHTRGKVVMTVQQGP